MKGLLINFLFLFVGAASAMPNQMLSKDCSELLAPQFDAAVDRKEFDSRIQDANGQTVEVPLGEGAEGTVILVGRKDPEGVSVWVEKRFFSRELALESYKRLKKMRELGAKGLLEPFKVVKPLGLIGKTLKLEYVPGQIIKKLRENPKYLDNPEFDRIFDQYIVGITTVANTMKVYGYHLALESSDDVDETPLSIYVSEFAGFDPLDFVFLGGEAPLFSIVDVNVVVDPKTHFMTIIDPH